MQKKVFYVGFTLFIIGAASVIYSEMFVKGVDYKEASVHVYSEWILKCNLTAGKTYMLYIESAEEWGMDFQKGVYDEPQPVNVTITSPEGGITKVRVMFYGLSESNPLYVEGRPPQIVDVEYFEVDESSLQTIPSTSKILLKTKRDGLYTVTVLREGLAHSYPPLEMFFYEEIVRNREAYSVLVHSGGVLCIIGVLFSVCGYFRRGKGKIKRKVKR
ncbi:MAG: hypothetical protein QW175_00295 [Candidatus Bathyarchaeia archaeon]